MLLSTHRLMAAVGNPKERKTVFASIDQRGDGKNGNLLKANPQDPRPGRG